MCNLIYSLKADYTGNAVILAHRTTIRQLAKMKDTTGAPIWVNSVAAGQPATFMGYPVYQANHMPEIAAGAKTVIFGDIGSAYFILNRPEIPVLQDIYTQRPLVGFYARHRVGGGVILPEALSVLSMHA
jgi:HK97 family phage major capsid protein